MNKILIAPLVGLVALLLTSCQTTSLGLYGQASDEQITQQVQRALYLTDDPIIANIRAESVNREVILTGYVKKISQSDDAEAIAKGVRSVQGVKNNIIVRR